MSQHVCHDLPIISVRRGSPICTPQTPRNHWVWESQNTEPEPVTESRRFRVSNRFRKSPGWFLLFGLPEPLGLGAIPCILHHPASGSACPNSVAGRKTCRLSRWLGSGVCSLCCIAYPSDGRRCRLCTPPPPQIRHLLG